MNYAAHFCVGILSGLFIVLYFSFPLDIYVLFWLMIAGFAALVPDIDHPKSKITQITHVIVLIGCVFIGFNTSIFTTFFQAACATVILYLSYIVLYHILKPRHRGITHSFTALVIVLLICLFLFKWPYSLFIPIGYASHLVADMTLKLI